MTEFSQKLRHYCRNLRCRSKLPSPVANEREAFCTRGCYESFYLHRCRGCEKRLEEKCRKLKPKNDSGRTKFVKVKNPSPTCGSAACKRDWRNKDGIGRFSAPKQPSGYQGSQKDELRKETPAAQALFSAIEAPTAAKTWRIVAGPELTAAQLHCATVPDGPNCRWEGGEYQRIEARNRALLRKHFAEQAGKCLIQPHHPPVNIVGGYRFPGAPVIGLSPVQPLAVEPRPALAIVSDDLSIPDFLRRSLPQEPRKFAA